MLFCMLIPFVLGADPAPVNGVAQDVAGAIPVTAEHEPFSAAGETWITGLEWTVGADPLFASWDIIACTESTVVGETERYAVHRLGMETASGREYVDLRLNQVTGTWTYRDDPASGGSYAISVADEDYDHIAFLNAQGVTEIALWVPAAWSEELFGWVPPGDKKCVCSTPAYGSCRVHLCRHNQVCDGSAGKCIWVDAHTITGSTGFTRQDRADMTWIGGGRLPVVEVETGAGPESEQPAH